MANQNSKDDFKSDALNSNPITEQSVNSESDVVVDEVFGEITHDGMNYRGLGWASAAVLMAKAQIGTGVLAMPYILQTTGAVPGVIIILATAAITTWSDWIMGVFKIKHPECYSLSDVGYVLAGPIGREVFGVAYWLFMTACVGSGLIGTSVAFNAITVHSLCTAIFVLIITIIVFIFANIPTLHRLAWLGWVGLASILIAILTLTISVGVQNRPAAAPQTGVWDKDIHAFVSTSFVDAINAVSTAVFAFCGTPAFLPIASEMRDVRYFKRSVSACQVLVTVTYTVIGIVVYYYCGQYVASPALGSAGRLMKKVCYGLALPGLLVSTTLYLHLAAKWLMLRFMRGSKHLNNAKSARYWVSWIGSVLGCTLFAYVIASAIPVFSGLVSLIGALFGTLMCMQVAGWMWLYDNWSLRDEKATNTFRLKLMIFWSSFVIVIGCFIWIAGTYGAVIGIKDIYAADGGSAAWSCADNSNSV